MYSTFMAVSGSVEDYRRYNLTLFIGSRVSAAGTLIFEAVLCRGEHNDGSHCRALGTHSRAEELCRAGDANLGHMCWPHLPCRPSIRSAALSAEPAEYGVEMALNGPFELSPACIKAV